MIAMQPPGFIFVTCQFGAEPALKGEIAQVAGVSPRVFAPGFLTFKLPTGVILPDDLDLHSTFARTYGFSLGKAMGTTADECAQAVTKLIDGWNFERLHVWQRDLHEPGFRGYEPGPNELTADADLAIRRVAPEFGVQESGVRSQESAVEDHVDSVPTESTSPHACGLARAANGPPRSPQFRPPRRTRARLRAGRTARVVDWLSPRGIDCIALARRNVSARVAGKRRLARLLENGRSLGLVAVAAASRRSVGRNRQRPGRRQSGVAWPRIESHRRRSGRHGSGRAGRSEFHALEKTRGRCRDGANFAA